MARFDVYATDGPEWLLDCQADLLSHFRTRFVVPLLPAEGAATATRLHPVFTIDGRKLIMVTQLASAVATSDLRHRVGNLADQHSAIMNAIDMLTSGY